MSNIFAYKTSVSRKDREKNKNNIGKVIWMSGLSGSGKSTISNLLENKLNLKNYHTYLLDGDNIRKGLCSDLGFSKLDRTENIRRVAEVSKLFCDAGIIVIVALISPMQTDRELAKNIISEKDFVGIYCKCSIDECIKRDPKLLYKKAINGEIKNFTGISSPYEIPTNFDIELDTENNTIEKCVDIIINKLY